MRWLYGYYDYFDEMYNYTFPKIYILNMSIYLLIRHSKSHVTDLNSSNGLHYISTIVFMFTVWYLQYTIQIFVNSKFTAS